jgi:hypothetical protein
MALLLQSKKGKLPLVNANGELVALATRAHFKANRGQPPQGAPAVAPDGRPRVGAAVGTRDDDKQRVGMLFEAGSVDAVILDSSQGDSTFQLAMLSHIKRAHPGVDVICGNVVTGAQVGPRARVRVHVCVVSGCASRQVWLVHGCGRREERRSSASTRRWAARPCVMTSSVRLIRAALRAPGGERPPFPCHLLTEPNPRVPQARRLIEAGADGLRVGMGSGSICTTQEVCAVGRGQATAVYHVRAGAPHICDSLGDGISPVLGAAPASDRGSLGLHARPAAAAAAPPRGAARFGAARHRDAALVCGPQQ